MTVRDSFSVVVDGDQLDDGYFNGVSNVLGKQNAISRLNHEYTSTGDRVTDEGFVFNIIKDKTDESYVDTANSTAYYDERGVVAFCDVLDLFDDSSIDSSIWSTATTGTGGAVTENADYLQCQVSSSSTGTASAISDGASGLTFDADSEAVLSILQSTNFPFGDDSGIVTTGKVQLSDGSTHIDLKTISFDSSAEGDNPSESAKLRLAYDHSADDVYVAEDYGAFGGAIDVSSLSASRHIRFIAQISSPNGTTTVNFRIYAVGYRKNGASSGTAIFQTASQTVDTTTASLLYNHYDDNVSPTNQTSSVSLNGGSNFSSEEVLEQWAAVTSGTSLVFKTTGDKPTTITVDGSTKFIPILKAWGALIN